MANAYSVEQVNQYIKRMFEQDFFLAKIMVKGEVSNCKYHSSGHIYFTLKDSNATLAVVMFASKRTGLKFKLQEGQKVVVTGSIETYVRDGRYQLYANQIVLDGAGELFLKFEALKRELSEMGMFEDEYKQPIPEFSKTVGIVTAPTGAAVRDIIQIASRRNPYVQLILYPALVQGEGASDSIVEGIEILDEYGVDVIIVGRGGGSMEDLWAFNEEKVARAIFHCNTPVISAVGHETDITIADFVADLRAPTPSAAAELAVFDFGLVEERMDELRRRLKAGLDFQIEYKRHIYDSFINRFRLLSPENQIREKRMMSLSLEQKMSGIMQRILEKHRYQLAVYIEKLNGLSPTAKLNQGYSYVAKENRNVSSIKQVTKGDCLDIYVTDGKIQTEVLSLEPLTHGKSRKS